MHILERIKKSIMNKSVKAGIWYTIGNYFLRGVGFITVPIFARLMTQEDFGNYNTFLAYEGIIYLFLTFGLHVSLKNARNDFGEDKLNEYTSSISIIPFISLIVITILSNIFIDPAQNILKLDWIQINLLLLYCFAYGMLIFYNNRIALDYSYKEFLALSYFNTFANVAISLALMFTIYKEQRYMARIIGTVSSLTIVLIYVIIKLWKKSVPKFNWQYWKYGLKLSVPIIPHGIGQVVLLSFDKIMINRYVGSAEAGIYSFAYTVYTIIQITARSLSTVYEPWAFKRLAKNENEIVIKRGTQFFYLLCCISAAVILIAPEMILFLGSEKYSESIYCVIPIIMGGTFAMAYNIPSLLTYYYKKTQYIAVGTVMAAILNIVLNYYFIKKYGYVAAAYTTLFCYFVYFVFHYILSFKLSGIKILPLHSTIFGFCCVIGVGVLTFVTLHYPLIRFGICSIIVIATATIVFLKLKRGELKS